MRTHAVSQHLLFLCSTSKIDPGLPTFLTCMLMLAWAAALRERAGVPHFSLHCTLLNVMTEIAFQPVRRRYMALVFTQDKRQHGMGGRLNLCTDGICTAFCWKTHPGSVRCCTKAGFPASAGTYSCLYSSFYSIFPPFVVRPFLLRSRRALHHIPLSFPCAPSQNIMCPTGKCSQNHFLQTTSQNIMQRFLV